MARKRKTPAVLEVSNTSVSNVISNNVTTESNNVVVSNTVFVANTTLNNEVNTTTVVTEKKPEEPVFEVTNVKSSAVELDRDFKVALNTVRREVEPDGNNPLYVIKCTSKDSIHFIGYNVVIDKSIPDGTIFIEGVGNNKKRIQITYK